MNLIYASGTITICTDHQTLFEYISNLENDKFWRKEINFTTMSSLPELGVLATEDSFLSKKVPNHILSLKCIEFQNNSCIVYETSPKSKFYLKSTRKVETISKKESRLIYTIEFDASVVKHGLGIGLPKFLIEFVTKSDMKKYLKKLKVILEKEF